VKHPSIEDIAKCFWIPIHPTTVVDDLFNVVLLRDGNKWTVMHSRRHAFVG